MKTFLKLMGECESARSILAAVLAARAAQPASKAAEVAASNEDHLLTIEGAATMLAVPTDWLYRRYKKLGIAVRLDKRHALFLPDGNPKLV